MTLVEEILIMSDSQRPHTRNAPKARSNNSEDVEWEPPSKYVTISQPLSRRPQRTRRLATQIFLDCVDVENVSSDSRQTGKCDSEWKYLFTKTKCAR